MNIDDYIRRIKGYAQTIRSRVEIEGCSADFHRILEIIRQVLFEELEFQGNLGEYYDPKNCFLNEVLERRLGIPVTLSILYLEILDDLGISAAGVYLPGYFLVKVKFSGQCYYVDAFNRGAILSPEEARTMMQGYPDHEAGKTDQEVQETSKKLILFHLLGNLKASYIARERFIQALNIMDKMLFLDRGSVEIYRDRGIIHFLLRDLRMALADLREYVKRAPNARDVRMIQLQVSSLEHIMFDLN